jgi:hypothetical protein
MNVVYHSRAGLFLQRVLLIAIFVSLFFSPKVVFSQSRTFRLYERNEIARLELLLADGELGDSSDLSVLFIQAIFERDGDQAVARIKELVRQEPRSKIVPAQLERLALHQFAFGLYNTARETFLFLTEEYQRTAYAERGLYYVARCWQAIGKTDSSNATLRTFRREYPRSRLIELAAIDLTERAKTEESQLADPADRVSEAIPIYSIQAGAFSTEANALIQKQFLENKGYRAEIYIKYVAARRFFVVCVGRYDSQQEAKDRGEVIARRYRIEYQIVDLSQLRQLD